MSRPRRFDWLFRPQMADEDLPLSAEARFAEALAELPAVERSALALSEIGGLDTDEIAQRLGTEPAVVRKLLLRARESVRASLATQGRRGLAALLPFQNLWQVGSSGPVVRAAGVVAAAIVAPTIVIGGAAADPPRATLTSPDPPHVRALAIAGRPVPVRSPVVEAVASAAAAAAPARRPAPPAARGERRSVRPGAGLQRDRDDAASVASVPARGPVPLEPAERAEPAQPAPAPERPTPTSPSETVASTVPRQVAPLPPPVPVPPLPVELPVQPPPLPVEPPPLPVPAPPPLPLLP